MNVVFIASIIIALTLLIGIVLAAIAGWFGRLVLREQSAATNEQAQFNANLSLGLEIPVYSEEAEQMEAARKLAAKRAASLPRWGNMRVGQMGKSDQQTAHDGLQNDPVTAVKIASIHGWQGTVTGMTSAEQAPAAAARATAQTTVPDKSVADLVPGKDYPFIEITDELSPAEKRKARIANSKARSAAVKALKASAGAMPAAAAAEPAVEAEAATAASQQAVTAAAPTGQPVAGVDYPVIEITDEMDPAEKRNARIANSKARSAAMKAYKQAGGSISASPAQAPIAETEPEQVQQTAETTPAESVTAVPANIQKPDYIEISDNMDPADIRQARIQNSKAKSAYNKALKAAGIDPSTVAD